MRPGVAKMVQGMDSERKLSTGVKIVDIMDVKKTSVADGSDSDEEDNEVPVMVKQVEGLDVEAAHVVERVSKAPTIGGPKPHCCYRFWNKIFKFFAHDSIYGSFVGPHPVSFLCCCISCKCCRKGTCIRPFILASVATKTMWFLMLIFIMILSCFFIIPYPARFTAPIRDFFPCNDGEEKNGTVTITNFRPVMDELKKDCSAHGGYFMVYRNFFAFCFLLLVSCLIMINVKSTNFNRKRAKMHHGFWMYKYIILFLLLLICYLGIRVEVGGIFEYIVSWIGLLSALIFSLVEITFLLDLVETYVVKNRTSTDDWADCLYWTFVGIVMIFDIGVIVALCQFYATDQYTDLKRINSINGTMTPAPDTTTISIMHVTIIAYGILMAITLIAMAVYNRRNGKFRFSGFLQTSFVIAYLLGVIWNALGNSPDVKSRPHYNPYDKSALEPQPGSEDVYFKSEGCVHGIAAFLALIYYVFWNGPRSKTAPLSILFDKVMYLKAKKPEIPVIPSAEDASEEFNTAIEELKVWDDEKTEVRYSWTMFYVIMILGSFSIMMAMCNFSDPWAIQYYASSIPALAIKIVLSFVVCLTYILTTTFPCRKIYPELFVEAQTVEDVPSPEVPVEEAVPAFNDNGDVKIEVQDVLADATPVPPIVKAPDAAAVVLNEVVPEVPQGTGPTKDNRPDPTKSSIMELM